MTKPAHAIFLVGFMGSGKTTIGRLLASRLGWRFLDLDDEIEAAAEMPILEIFKASGEARFRELETEALGRVTEVVTAEHPTVVSLGGGTFVSEANRARIEAAGVSVWLDCPFEMLWRRVREHENRPLARSAGQFFELFEARLPVYALADYRLPVTSDDPGEAVQAILDLGLPF